MNKLKLIAALLAVPFAVAAKTFTEPHYLPPPSEAGGMSLNEAISKRRTTREFTPEALNTQDLADLCFAAFGISSPDGKRTIPTALNRQDLVIYVLKADGAWRYETLMVSPGNKMLHGLRPVSKEDLRKYATKRPGMGEAGACSFVICGDKSKWADNKGGEKYMYVHAGAAMQNLYLMAAARNLATVVCGSFDNEALRMGLSLPENQEILLVQIVGSRKKD